MLFIYFTYALLQTDDIISPDLLYHVIPQNLEVFTSVLCVGRQQLHDVENLLVRLGGQYGAGDSGVDVVHIPLCEQTPDVLKRDASRFLHQ